MKAIGTVPVQTGSDKLLVEMTRDEWNMIAGDLYRQEEAGVGSTVDVAKVYFRAMALEGNKRDLQRARRTLESIARTLEPMEGVVGCEPEMEAIAGGR